MSTRLNLLLGVWLILILIFRLITFNLRRPRFKEGQKVELIATLTSQSQAYPRSQRLEVQGIKVITESFPEYSYGDRLKISGTLKNGVLVFPEIEVVEREKGSPFLRKVYSLRKRITFLFESYLPTPAGPLLLGIFLGVKRTMPTDFYLALRKTGVLHVVVASGMNVTMLADFIFAIFSFLLKRRQLVLLSIVTVLFYTALVGFDPPIVRAAIMITAAFLGQFFGRFTFGLLSLLLSGYLMIFVNPTLISDLGFQLSFVSTAGLILIKPLFPAKSDEHFKVFKEDFRTTISAQVATMPILLSNFGQYQVMSLLVNTLVLWTAPTLMALGVAAAIIGPLWAPLGQLVVFLAFPFLLYFEKVILFFGRASLAELRVGKPPLVFILGYYLLLTAILIFCYKRKRKGNSAYYDRGV